MKIVTFSDPHRQKHFDFFKNMTNPHFNVTANVDITPLVKAVKDRGLSFTPVIVYCVSSIANKAPAFRYRIRGEEIVEHELVHPSFSILTEVSDVFSFCYVDFQKDFSAFYEECMRRIAIVKQDPSFEDEPGRDDYLFLSSFPWFSFTGILHAMNYEAVDSVPRIAWAKYFEENGRIKMPLALQAHHAIVDGRHMGHYLQEFEAMANDLNFLS